VAFEYYHALHRGDRSRFEVDLIRSSNSNATNGSSFSSGLQESPLR
jgi:hypothetical protein